MDARRAVGAALRSGNTEALATARAGVQSAKVALGERGPVWWTDGAPDLNRRMARNTVYAAWFDGLEAYGQPGRSPALLNDANARRPRPPDTRAAGGVLLSVGPVDPVAGLPLA